MIISKGIQQMLIATVFFATMNLLVKFVSHIPAYEVVFFRCVISLVITLGFLWKLGIPIFGKNKKLLVLRGIFGITALTMYFTTLQNIPLASAVIIQYLSPIFTTLFAIWLLKEPVKKVQWLFFALAFAGVFLIKGFDDRIEVIFFVLGIAAAIFSALAYNCVRMLKDTDHPLVVVLYFPLIGMPVTGIMSATNWVMPSGWDWLILLAIGITTQIAQVNMTKALQTEKIATISSIRYLGVLYALGFGFFFFDETYSWIALIGIILVLAGVVANVFYKRLTIKNNV